MATILSSQASNKTSKNSSNPRRESNTNIIMAQNGMTNNDNNDNKKKQLLLRQHQLDMTTFDKQLLRVLEDHNGWKNDAEMMISLCSIFFLSKHLGENIVQV